MLRCFSPGALTGVKPGERHGIAMALEKIVPATHARVMDAPVQGAHD